MKRVLVLILLAALISSTFPTIAIALTPSAGAACSKIGQTVKYSNKKFTCIKLGKRLVWDKGVALKNPVVTTPTPSPISTPTPSPTPTPTVTTLPTPISTSTAKPSPAPFKAIIPIPLPVIQNKTITFADAVSKYAQIPQVAWQNIQDTIAANSAVDIPTTIVIGPNTDTTIEQITNALKKEYRLWSGFAQPISYAGLVYNAKDESWAETEWPKMAARLNLTNNPSVWIPNHLRAGCNFDNGVATECYGGMALTFAGTDAGFAFYGVQSPYWSQSSFQSGPFSQVTHEYLHNVQMAQWNGFTLPSGIVLRSQIAHNSYPCWFSEGQANAIGIPVVSNDLDSYIRGRDNSIRRKINQNMPVKPSLSDNGLTADAIGSFLYNQDPATCYNPDTNGDYQLGYNIGYAATEVLVAIGGPQSTMALLGETASGMTWAEAFQAVYGITWKEASVILGKVLAAEYSTKPMDH